MIDISTRTCVRGLLGKKKEGKYRLCISQRFLNSPYNTEMLSLCVTSGHFLTLKLDDNAAECWTSIFENDDVSIRATLANIRRRDGIADSVIKV